MCVSVVLCACVCLCVFGHVCLHEWMDGMDGPDRRSSLISVPLVAQSLDTITCKLCYLWAPWIRTRRLLRFTWAATQTKIERGVSQLATTCQSLNPKLMRNRYWSGTDTWTRTHTKSGSTVSQAHIYGVIKVKWSSCAKEIVVWSSSLMGSGKRW